MTTHYVAVDQLSEIADLGVDDNGRAQHAVNLIAWKRPSDAFLREVVAILVAAGVGEEAVSIFAGSKASVPTGPGPFLTVRSTGGPAPLGTHNDGVRAYPRPTMQLLARASTDAAALAMVTAALEALIAIRNQAVSA